MAETNCLICERIRLIKKNKNPYFVKELKTGYVVIGDEQYFKGYTLFLCKQHVNELHELPKNYRLLFLEEMSKVSEAVFKTFQPKKLNYSLLGNTFSHLHWHLFPRYGTDPNPKMPAWAIEEKLRKSIKIINHPKELEDLKKILNETLDSN